MCYTVLRKTCVTQQCKVYCVSYQEINVIKMQACNSLYSIEYSPVCSSWSSRVGIVVYLLVYLFCN